MLGTLIRRIITTRDEIAPFAVRCAAGIVFFLFSLGKFRRHDAESNAFDRYGIPFPDAATYLVGTLELVGGLLLVAGLLARPVALALALNMVGALTTAGRIEPSFTHTALPPILILGMLVVIWRGAGSLSADLRIGGHPGTGRRSSPNTA